MTLPCISLWQPWASLIAIGAKRVETRSWSTSYRGEIAIHAAKRFTPEEQTVCLVEPFRSALAGFPKADNHRQGYFYPDLPLGTIVAVARLVDVLPTNDICIFGGQLTSCQYDPNDGYFPCGPNEADFGDFSPGRYAWLLSDVRRLRTPISTKGARMIWPAPIHIESAVRAQLGEAPHV